MFKATLSFIGFMMFCVVSLLHSGNPPFFSSSTSTTTHQTQHQKHSSSNNFAILPTRLQEPRVQLGFEPEEEDVDPPPTYIGSAVFPFNGTEPSVNVGKVATFNLIPLTHARKAWLFENLYSRYAHA
ncbi:hypothetical protein [Vibrio mimicus]|uniref:hypothetical protein n=1 Tax=Vibrio mimicus TaxID=674 RepID=UPI000306EBBA|nr:hypothetical protein [Vibrio mimicus]